MSNVAEPAPPPPVREVPAPGYDHTSLRAQAMQVRSIEKVMRSLENQRRALGADLPPLALVALDEALAALKPVRSAVARQLPKIIAGSPLGEWIKETRGLAGGLVLLLGSMPPIAEFAGPAAVWKFTGLDVREGRAPKGQRGERLGFNRLLRSYAIMRVADPVMKTGGPFRAVYDVRKARTSETHPDMFVHDGEQHTGELANPWCASCLSAVQQTEEHRAARALERERTTVAFDCSHFGGTHWTAGHRHQDALRVTAKAVLRDAWRVARGMPARYAAEEMAAV